MELALQGLGVRSTKNRSRRLESGGLAGNNLAHSGFGLELPHEVHVFFLLFSVTAATSGLLFFLSLLAFLFLLVPLPDHEKREEKEEKKRQFGEDLGNRLRRYVPVANTVGNKLVPGGRCRPSRGAPVSPDVAF